MAYSFGGGVNAQLGAVDYSPFLRGSLQGSQMAAQGAQAQGQAIGQAGQMVGSAIMQASQMYDAKQKEKEQENNAAALATGIVSKNPEFARMLNIGDASTPEGQKKIRAVIKEVGVDKILGMGMEMQQQEEQQAMRAEQQRAIAEAMRPGPSQAQRMLQGGANFEQLQGASFQQAPASAADFLQRGAGRVDPNVLAGLGNAMTNAQRSQQAQGMDPLTAAKTLAEIENLKARTAAVGQPNLRDDLVKLQIKQAEGAITSAETKKLKEAEQYTKKAENRLAQIQSLRTQISEAAKLAADPAVPTTGVFGEVGKMVPGTPAYNLAAKLETILANTGFDRLQQMREESPTGGALGQVAVQELVALQNSIASLKQGQSKDQLLANLNKVDAAYQRFEEALSKDTGGVATPPPATSKAQAILDKYGIK